MKWMEVLLMAVAVGMMAMAGCGDDEENPVSCTTSSVEMVTTDEHGNDLGRISPEVCGRWAADPDFYRVSIPDTLNVGSSDDGTVYFDVEPFPNPVSIDLGRRITFQYNVRELTHVQLVIVDEDGRVQRRLVDHPAMAGGWRVPWDLRDEEGETIPAGTYMAYLYWGESSSIQKAVQVTSIGEWTTSPACRNWADEHWDPLTYLAWRVTSRAGRNNDMVYALPCSTEIADGRFVECSNQETDRYHAMIGKYDQFVAGWGDVVDRQGDPVQYTEVESVDDVSSVARSDYIDQGCVP